MQHSARYSYYSRCIGRGVFSLRFSRAESRRALNMRLAGCAGNPSWGSNRGRWQWHVRTLSTRPCMAANACSGRKRREEGACVRRRVGAVPMAVCASRSASGGRYTCLCTCTPAPVTFRHNHIPSACLSPQCSRVQHCARYEYYCHFIGHGVRTVRLLPKQS